MKSRTAPTISLKIYVSGDMDVIAQVCREHCWDHEMCVNVSPTTFFYQGCEESGAIIGLVNYPKHPCTMDELMTNARMIARGIVLRCRRYSAMIEGPVESEWFQFDPPSELLRYEQDNEY